MTGVHFHDSIVFIDKGRQHRPMLARMGVDKEPVQLWLDKGPVADSTPEDFAARGSPT